MEKNAKNSILKFRRFYKEEKQNELTKIEKEDQENIASHRSPQTLTDQIKNLENRMQLLENSINQQNNLIISQLAAIKMRLLCTNKRTTDSIASLFPIRNTDELRKFESNIAEISEDLKIQCVRKIIGTSGLTKRLGNLLGAQILAEYNYEGLQNKKTFKEFTKTNHIFFESIKYEVVTTDNYVKMMKAAFKRAKNQIYKEKYLKKKLSKSSQSS